MSNVFKAVTAGSLPPVVTETITGNSGVATASGNNINLVTAGTTVQFVGAGSTITQDFALSNLLLGSNGSTITTGNSNSGFGEVALASITTAERLTAVGTGALQSATTNLDCTAIGTSALLSNTGNSNTACGSSALILSTTASNCSAFGSGSMANGIVTGDNNSGFGAFSFQALSTGTLNCAFGYQTFLLLRTGSQNVGLGALAGNNYTNSESNNICIGYNVLGTAGESNVIRIGNTSITSTFINGINGLTVAASAPVGVTSTGQLSSLGFGTSTQVLTSTGPTTSPTWQAAAGLTGTATQFDVLVGGAANTIASVGPGTTGQLLQSNGAASNPSYTTATYPATTTINQILYSSAANTVTALATANSGVLATSPSGVPSISPTPRVTSITFDGTNFLGNYAIGTFTPTITCSGTPPTITYTNQKGTWTRIGNRCFVDCTIQMSAYTQGSNNAINITGLPFTCNAAGGIPQGSCASGSVTIATDTWLNSEITPGGTLFQVMASGSALGGGPLFSTAFPAGSSSLFISIVYQI